MVTNAVRTNGMECIVGCTPSILSNIPTIGSVITIKHSGYYKNGTLRHAFYWRTRGDIEWEAISQESREIVIFFVFI